MSQSCHALTGHSNLTNVRKEPQVQRVAGRQHDEHRMDASRH